MADLALIVGVGDGLSASLARNLAADHDLVLTARNTDKLEHLARDTNARTAAMDASDPQAMAELFGDIEGRLAVAVYNPSYRVKGPVAEMDPAEVRKALDITAFGAFLMGRLAARRMLDQDERDGRRGTILFTGASAGVKGFAQSASFAMGKFAQRGLAQSMARELHPRGIHVAWINIDGGILLPSRTESTPDSMLHPDAIAAEYRNLIVQHRSTWANELSLRPWVETF